LRYKPPDGRSIAEPVWAGILINPNLHLRHGPGLYIEYSLAMPSGGHLPPVGSYNALGMRGVISVDLDGYRVKINKINNRATRDNCNTMCPYVCCVYCLDPVWIPSVHACVELVFRVFTSI
jgi:hypothetical protein